MRGYNTLDACVVLLRRRMEKMIDELQTTGTPAETAVNAETAQEPAEAPAEKGAAFAEEGEKT